MAGVLEERMNGNADAAPRHCGGREHLHTRFAVLEISASCWTFDRD
jgi:hypothetical protein